MCQFKSAIVIKDKQEKYGFRLLMSPVTESHSDLEQLLNLKDGARLNYAKVEFTPKDFSTAHRVETYTLKINEKRTPDWFDEEIKDRVIEKMTSYLKTIIINDERKIILGGQWILGPKAKIDTAKNVVINFLNGGTITSFEGGTIGTFEDGTINRFWSGTITIFWNGTINYSYNGTINNFRGGIINNFYNGTIDNFWRGNITSFEGGIIGLFESGTITSFEGGTINTLMGGTIDHFKGGTITNFKGGTISYFYDGIIGKDYRKK